MPGTFQGQEYYDFNQDGAFDPDERVYVTVPKGDAYVYGVELWCRSHLNLFLPFLSKNWSLSGGFMWNYGRDITDDAPLRHTHPARGLATLRWDNGNGEWFEFCGEFVRKFGRVVPSRLATDVGYLKNPQDPESGLIRDFGLPGYSVFDIRGGFDLGKYVSVTLALENIFDKGYRRAHSRWDESGFNAIVGLSLRPFK